VEISASINRDGRVATVVVSGEVDIASVPTVDRAIHEAVTTDGVNTVRVDLSAVRFLDSSGISLLLKGRRLADDRAISYQVTRACGTVLRVLELSGVWEHLHGDSDPSAQK
jgi:anti-sigma B factor antagonist